MIKYLTEDEIVEFNKDVLSQIKVKKADAHKVLSRAIITDAIEASKRDAGDLYDKASTLLIKLTKRHAFDSGNRRTALLATITFLEMNGEHPKVVHDPKVMQGIREGFYDKTQIKNWLKGLAVPPFRRD